MPKNMKKTITITSDFGDQFASAQLRAVIASLGFDGNLIENHSVSPYSITEGAFEIQQLAKYSTGNSVHVGIVDPGVGTKRFGVIIKTKKSWLIGPNNGLLYPAAIKERILSIWKINEGYFGKDVANTFHGRDIFIKAAVFLAQGINPQEFSCRKIDIDILVKKVFQPGEVLHIDAYGNYKIHWPHKIIPEQTLALVAGNKHINIPVVRTFEGVLPNKPLVIKGSHGTLELAINLGNAHKVFSFRIGQILNLKFSLDSSPVAQL